MENICEKEVTSGKREVKKSHTWCDVKINYDSLKKEMGEVKFNAMEAEYCKWVEEANMRWKTFGLPVVGNSGCTHPFMSWELEFENDDDRKKEMFVRQYLVQHDMEFILSWSIAYPRRYRLIGPIKLDKTIRQRIIFKVRTITEHDMQEIITPYTERYASFMDLDPQELVDDFYKYWRNALKLIRCNDDGPPIPEGWCFFEPLERNLPLIATARMCRILTELDVQIWVKNDISCTECRSADFIDRGPDIVWHRSHG